MGSSAAWAGGAVSGEALPAEVAAALAAHGVNPGPAGYDAAVLTAAAEARGLTASVEEVAGAPLTAAGRYRALLWRAEARVWCGRAKELRVTHDWAQARGRTEAAALGKALARWLERHGGEA